MTVRGKAQVFKAKGKQNKHATRRVLIEVKQTTTVNAKGNTWYEPVLERRCICDFCLVLALWPALEAGFDFVGCATAMLTCDVLMRSSVWWW